MKFAKINILLNWVRVMARMPVWVMAKVKAVNSYQP
jgi:hypothetical protein